MDITNSFKEAFTRKILNLNITSGEFVLNLLIAIILVIVGLFLGKLVKFGLRKFVEKLKVEKLINPSFINLFLVVIKWSIYVLFIDLALIQLRMPVLVGWLISILAVIPSLTGALIIISVGFGIATFLRKIIEDSKVREWKKLSEIFFYFVIYIFIIFALKTALISVKDSFLVNMLVIIFTVLAGVALLINYFFHKS